MDAIILTRWAKRRLPALRAARELRLEEIKLETAQQEAQKEEVKNQNGSKISSYIDGENSLNQFIAFDEKGQKNFGDTDFVTRLQKQMKGTKVPGNHFADFDQDSPRSLGINTGRGGANEKE